MKKVKKAFPIIIIVLIIGIVYSFFHISGKEIKNINKLPDAGYVTVIVRTKNIDEKTEYILNGGTSYHKIKNSGFEKELISILELNEEE